MYFSTRRYIALAAIIVKSYIGGPKRLKTNKFVRTKSHTGSNFSKYLWGCYALEGL